MARKCKCGCGIELPPASKCTDILSKKRFASVECLTRDTRAREAAKAEKAIQKRNVAFKNKVRKRTGKGGYYDAMKKALHYYVKHHLRKGEPCYTCGLKQKNSDNPQAFHVGHFMPAKMVDPRRFMLENLRIQCNSCNTHNSGRQAVYRERLIEEMGIDHVEWLECEVNHKSLKEQYPDNESMKKEIARFNKLSRDCEKPRQCGWLC